jgi:hypothetical protein
MSTFSLPEAIIAHKKRKIKGLRETFGRSQPPTLEKTCVTTYYGHMTSFQPTTRIFRIFLLSLFGMTAVSAAIAMKPFLFVLPPDRPGCDMPMSYRIDPPDPRFSFDSVAFRRGVFEAEAVWEKGIGKDLFVYDPTAPLVIRTEFDERQKMTHEAKVLEERISEYETEGAKLDREHAAAVARYEKESASFKDQADSFNRKLAKYNEDVKEWNESGQGTLEEYESLEKRREKLEKEERNLVEASEKIAELADIANSLVGKLNQKATEINRNIGIFRERYGEPKPFVQGLYDPIIPSVTVFQFEDKDDLRLVLAHEFGHALGIEEHAESGSSLMHYLMGGQDLENPRLSAEDIAAYAEACPIRNVSKRETLVRYLVHEPLEDMSAWDIAGILMRE